MLSNFAKIFIKYSLFLFIFLSEIQEIFCMDDEMTGLFAKSPSIARTKKDKENSREVENIGLDIRVAEWSSSRRPLHPANQLKSRQSRYGAPKDLGVPIAGAKADVEILTQNKRPRPDFSLSPEESSEDPVPESKSLTLFELLEEKEALEVQILNASLYQTKLTSKNVDLSYFTPTKVEGYLRAGGESPELRTNIRVLKTSYPKPILDIEHFSRDDQKIFSPAVRHLPRQTVEQLRLSEVVRHLPDYATREPITVETNEERIVRKETQRKEFEELEAKAGRISTHITSERERALKPWIPYFNYITMKKDQGFLLRWPDLVGAFLKYVAPCMKYLEIEKYDVYFSLDTLDFERKNAENGKANHALMQSGKCPYGVDGFIMNWHHVTRIDVHSHDIKIDDTTKQNCEGPYKLVLIPAFIHTEYDALLHPSHYVAPRKEIDRADFGDSREVINQTVRDQFYVGK